MKLRPVAKFHGGKFPLCTFIINHLPDGYEGMTYVEPYGGMANILQNKARSVREVYNDANPALVNLVWAMASGALASHVINIPYSKESFEHALASLGSSNRIEAATAELVARRMSRGGLCKDFAWSNRSRGGRFGDVNAFETWKLLLPALQERWTGVIIHNEPAENIITRYDSPETLFYMDPPYLPSTRQYLKAYDDYEMSEEQHVRLADLLTKVAGKVMLSGYPSPLYDKLYEGWRVERKKVKNNSGQGKKKNDRTECLWMNY